jgi:transposase-like protein
VHLIRGTFRYAGRQHRDAIAKAIRPIYTAVNAEAAREALDAFDADWGHRYPAAIRLWRNAWQEFIPFLDYDTEIRKVICSTNAGIAECPLPPRHPVRGHSPPSRQP